MEAADITAPGTDSTIFIFFLDRRKKNQRLLFGPNLRNFFGTFVIDNFLLDLFHGVYPLVKINCLNPIYTGSFRKWCFLRQLLVRTSAEIAGGQIRRNPGLNGFPQGGIHFI